ncbi:hypothetical protein K456DRAFT_45868 [Colletotrichum gloeosporioides 23]|nr:hypothetical protein K456DRAFT_45868 [Colletotrichum gloeosporioides 23]
MRALRQHSQHPQRAAAPHANSSWYSVVHVQCVDSTARKDNYLRHLKSCKMKDKTGPSFFCICGTEHNNLEEHSNHVKDCKQRR